MRWLAFPIALLAGLALALVVGASAQSICPSGYHVGHRHHVTLCLRTVTQTATVRLAAPAAQTVTVAGPATTLPASTTTVPTTLTVTAPPRTDTVTQTLPTQTVVSTETTTVQAPPITTTVTGTTTAPSTVSLTWCGGYGGNWSSGNCDAPPSPLSVPGGSRVELAALAQGSGSDPYPAGCLDFQVATPSPSAVWSEYDQEYGLNPAASHDCSCVENFSGQASGACLYTFGTAGVYAVSVASGTAAPITTDVQVG